MDTQDKIRAQREQQAADMVARLRRTLPPVLVEYPIDAAYVCGSVARGTVLPSSDVDIALSTNGSISIVLPSRWRRASGTLTLLPRPGVCEMHCSNECIERDCSTAMTHEEIRLTALSSAAG